MSVLLMYPLTHEMAASAAGVTGAPEQR